jgi:aspartate racemase
VVVFGRNGFLLDGNLLNFRLKQTFNGFRRIKRVKIGVLGGIGPEATGYFYLKLIRGLQEQGLIKSNTDFPQIIINSIPAPELISLSIDEAELEPYISGIKELDKLGVDFIAMVCNTIHLYLDMLQTHVHAPIINLREEIHRLLLKNGTKSTLIIGTPQTLRQGLYRFKGIKAFEPDSAETQLLASAISNFNTGKEKPEQVQVVSDICQKYLKRGAEIVILGCTEFAVVLENAEFPKINTIDVLVNVAIREFCAMSKPRKSLRKL